MVKVTKKIDIIATAAVATTLAVEKVTRLAEECGVKCLHLDSRMDERRRWNNDFEIEGLSGKVEVCVRRIRDLEVR